MPHVASQMLPGELFLEIPRSRRAVVMSESSVEFQRPATALPRRRRRTNHADEVPNLSLHANMPDYQQWDFGSAQYVQKQPLSSESSTPNSSVCSVFDLYSPESVKSSPNSSILPSFVAELEDTSTTGVTKKCSTLMDDPYVNQLSVPQKSTCLTDNACIGPLSVSKKPPHVVQESYFEKLTRPEFCVRSSLSFIGNQGLSR